MPRVRRSSAIDCTVTAFPTSSRAPLVPIKSALSKVAKSKRCPSTNTLATISPPPPDLGCAWQPKHELESAAEMRLIFRGNTSGARGSESEAPVPLV